MGTYLWSQQILMERLPCAGHGAPWKDITEQVKGLLTSQHLQSSRRHSHPQTVTQSQNHRCLNGRKGRYTAPWSLITPQSLEHPMFSSDSILMVKGSTEAFSPSHPVCLSPYPGISPLPSLCLSHTWQLEYTARLDFLWRVQAKEEINEMKELREHNENMLRNILPSHVARHFLEKDRDNEVSPGLSGREEGWWWAGCYWTHWSRALGKSRCPRVSTENGDRATPESQATQTA